MSTQDRPQAGGAREAELAIVRRAYAKHVLANAEVEDPRVEAAFAAVRREQFLGPGPWPMFRWPRRYVTTPSEDPVHLYQDALFGIIPITLYFIISFYFLYWLSNLTDFSRKIYKRMSLLQVGTTFIFLSLMISLPIKILLRLVFRVHYVWETPWFSV